MEKAAAYTLESVKKSAYGIDESGRVHIGNALRTGQSPWATISEVQQRFNLSVNGCNCAIQFLHSMDSTNSSINVALVDALITQLDAMVERLDQNSRLELLKQTIRLIEVKELQCVSIAIMKRLDTIPEKYLKRLIAKGLISEFPTVVRRQGWRLDNRYFVRSIEEVLLENSHNDKSDLQARPTVGAADTQQLELHVSRLVSMIETSKELFENLAEYCTQQSLLSRRGARPPTPAQPSSGAATSSAFESAGQGLLTDTDSQDPTSCTTVRKPDQQGVADKQRLLAYNFANLLRRVLVTLQEKGQKIQSVEKLHDFAMVLDRCKRQKVVDATAIASILQHFADMIRGREAAETKAFTHLMDIYIVSQPAKAATKERKIKAPKAPKAPVAPRPSKRKAAALESASDDSDGLNDSDASSAASFGARKVSSKKKPPGRQAARKKSRVVESGDSSEHGDSDGDGEEAEPVLSQEALELYIQEGLDALRSVDQLQDFSLEVTNAVCPGYSDIVSQPMDMIKMQRKLTAHEYRSLKDVDRDVRLMVRNCEAFHGKQSPYTKVGFLMQRKWKKCSKDFRERAAHEADELTNKATKPAPRKRIVINTKPTAAAAAAFSSPPLLHGPSTAQLIADVPEVVISPTAAKIMESLDEIPRADKIKTEELVHEVLTIACYFLKAVDHTGTFVKRVSDREAPGYSSVVTTPMELTTMKRKVMSRDYSSIDEFADDAKLISSNCLAYNNRSKRYIEMAVHFKQAWEHFREHAVQRYPTITAKSLTSTRVEIPSMDRGYYINDEPEGEDEAIELPYILTPQQIRQAVDAEMVDLHSGPGLRVIMNLVLGYMEMLDDQGQFASPVLIPDYLQTITNPMDFGTMRVKVDRKKYKTLEEFEKDLMLVFQNCFQYNGLDEISMYVEQMQFGWFLIHQNIQSVLQDDPDLAVELKPPHILGGGDAGPAMTSDYNKASTSHSAPSPRKSTPAQSSEGRHRADGSLIKLPFLYTRQKLLSRLKAKDLKAASTLREIMQLVWGYFTALDSQGYFAGPVTTADYLEKVPEPMDLGTMKLKVDRKKCKSLEEFESDLSLLTSNCFAFYDVHSPQYKCAERIEYAWLLVKANIESVLTDNASLARELPAEHIEDKNATTESTQPAQAAPAPSTVHSQPTTPSYPLSTAAQLEPEQSAEVKAMPGAMDVVVDDAAEVAQDTQDALEEPAAAAPTSSVLDHAGQSPTVPVHLKRESEVISDESDAVMSNDEPQHETADEPTAEALEEAPSEIGELTIALDCPLQTETQMLVEVAEVSGSAVIVPPVNSTKTEVELHQSVVVTVSHHPATPVTMPGDQAAASTSEVFAAQSVMTSRTPTRDSSYVELRASTPVNTASSTAVVPPPVSGPIKPVPSLLLRWLTSAKERLQKPLRLAAGKVVEFAEGINSPDGIVLQDLPPVIADYHVSWALTMLRDTALQQLFRKQLAMRLRELIVASSDTSAGTATTSVKTEDGCFAHRVSFPHADVLCRNLFQLCQMSLTYENRIEALDDHVLRVYLPLLVYYTVRPDDNIPVPAASDSKASNATAKAVVKKVLEHSEPLAVLASRPERLKSCYSERGVLREFLESIGTHLVNMKLKG